MLPRHPTTYQVKRKQKREQEYEERLRAIERQQHTINNMEKKEYGHTSRIPRNEPTNRRTDEPRTDEPTNRRTNQPTDQPTNQPQRQQALPRAVLRTSTYALAGHPPDSPHHPPPPPPPPRYDRERKKRLDQDRYLDNMERQRMLRIAKEEQAEHERARAREREQNTVKDQLKKEYDKEKKKRLLADKCKTCD